MASARAYCVWASITMDLFLLFRKSEVEVIKGKEAIEFKIRGRISFLTHCMGDRTSPRTDYVVASIKHWTNLLKICQKALKNMVLGSGIRDPRSGIRKKPIPDPGSRIQGSKSTRSRIQDPNPQH